MTGARIVHILPRGLFWLGAIALLVSIVWWWLVFRQVIAYDYISAPRAVLCLGNSDTICDLAMSLCGSKHPLAISWYSPSLLWAGLAVASAGLLLAPRRA